MGSAGVEIFYSDTTRRHPTIHLVEIKNHFFLVQKMLFPSISDFDTAPQGG